MFAAIRRIPLGVLGLVLLAGTALIFWINTVAFPRGLFAPLAELSHGWVSPTLVAGVLFLTVSVPLLFRVGRLRPDDIGWRAADLRTGLALLLGLAVLLQVQAVITALGGAAPVALAPVWTERGAGVVLGALVAQLLGTALAEETLFRGVLFPQLYVRFAGRMRPRWALGIAVLLSQLLFAAAHLPNRFYLGMAGPVLLQDLIMLFTVGVVFALLYVATGNLFLVVGLHALFNAPVLLFAGSEAASRNLLLACTLLLLVLWRPLAALRMVRSRVVAVAPESA